MEGDLKPLAAIIYIAYWVFVLTALVIIGNQLERIADSLEVIANRPVVQTETGE